MNKIKLLLPLFGILAIEAANASININISPIGSTEVVSGGGDLMFSLKITNEFSVTKNVDYFSYLIFPDSKHYNIDAPLEQTLSPGEQYEPSKRILNIPNWFPGGNYTYRFSTQDRSTGKINFQEFKFSKQTDGIRLFGHGVFQTCAMDSLGLECWGDRGKYVDQGQYSIPVLSEIEEVSIGGGFNCVLEKGKSRPRCWGKNDIRTSAPSLNNPRNIVSGDAHSCAIVDSVKKVECWGYSPDGEATPPSTSLNNPIQITTSDSHSCALNQPASGSNFVKCWGYRDYINVPSQINPTYITSGGRASCMIDEGQVICWGTGPVSSPLLDNPTSLVVHNSEACAIDNNGLICWDSTAENITDIDDISGLSNPTQIVLSYGYKCAVDDGGVKCWGKNANKDTIPTRFIIPSS
ncbi:hypothetical protein H5119_09315 [Pseudoalteromonas sp. SG45-5]|uniref:RCC1 domain-containing protein n=1 Tax=unclassified Pseudoalteromonas TaxID=194690 RepID=UPI00110A706F|nr:MULTISPECIES: hypothetical protein [unclassified Pseudoalteromonas]MBB1385738.1 hypothetical protein [Pseudoalteromonas sp. SG45-5]MBB1393631.1 hypothetical protein [Pseudoalteromonas sp. SG44-4]MBB1446224.1 hypothetical protein [Pseudoalteromonas sp. SG41-6]TMO08712.1 hypothetical protein CWB66_02690 [Pseudoalteromonas sp. S558]